VGLPTGSGDGGMTVTWWEQPTGTDPGDHDGRASLRLVGDDPPVAIPPRVFTLVHGGPAARTAPRVPLEVRRRRTILAVMAVLLVALALPLGGTGGHSHATGSAPAETGSPVVYTVHPGDSLWSIAQLADPNGDPRPRMARRGAPTGSDTVEPGERIVIP